MPCLVGPVMQPIENMETANATYENAALLQQAGVPIAIMTGYVGYVPKSRVLVVRSGDRRGKWTGDGAGAACDHHSPAKILVSTTGLVRSPRARTRTRRLRRRSLRVHQPCAAGAGPGSGYLPQTLGKCIAVVPAPDVSPGERVFKPAGNARYKILGFSPGGCASIPETLMTTQTVLISPSGPH